MPKKESMVTTARSVALARKGLQTGSEIVKFLNAVIVDALEEEITTAQASVAVDAVGKMLKVIDLKFRYGKPNRSGERQLEC